MKLTTFTIPDSLGSSPVSPFTLIDNRLDPPLRREDVGSRPLGTKGNLRYTVWKGGTARASHVGIRLSEMRRSLASRWANWEVRLKTYFTPESSQARGQRERLAQNRVEARDNSRRIGDLLGSLTAKVDEAGQFAKVNDCVEIVQALMELNVPPEGSIFSLKGVRYSLDIYLNELKETDLVALSQGVLSNEEACKVVLDRISNYPDDAVRMRASQALRDIAQAVNHRVLSYTMDEPLSQIPCLLSARPVDGQKLHELLLRLPDDKDKMASYFLSLSTSAFMNWLDIPFGRLSEAEQALSRITDGSRMKSLSMLEIVFDLVEDQFLARAPADLKVCTSALDAHLRAEDRHAVANDLYQLSVEVERVSEQFGALLFDEERGVRRLVGESMKLFRDDQNNPDGPLNDHSLSRLDANMRAKLADAARVLRPYGLMLA